MNVDRTVLFGVVILAVVGLLIIVFVLPTKSGETENKPEPALDIGNIIDEAVTTIEETPEKIPTPVGNTTGAVDTPLIAPRDLADRYAEDLKRQREEVTTMIGEAIDTSGAGELTDRETTVVTSPVSEEDDRIIIEEALAQEQEKWENFVEELQSWVNIGRSAYQSRARAEEIRNQARQIYEDTPAVDEVYPDPDRIKACMTRRADLMMELANRLSSTRGNDRKISILIKDLEDYRKKRVTETE
ncbi:hypothetical protein DRQ36_09330 [bacterium]|nr:MAG: hypothetical protein DRQ36_09330 [bacterium]